ncbi:Fluconazole resistance protein 1 [Colletotrichum tanaceti]|uniref:Fluconazole resistance protein 1 n=1 Tax=Colletotrichum tanaceti TaxID=1306861 RepID=A0A4U6XQS5_9PEZI|nr:Fluconazole resistance protein 1 [Colletotrichum tanaceti]TKW58019.1 Fluconazole resistance protein 1 [Colletotrichum tanaceti]
MTSHRDRPTGAVDLNVSFETVLPVPVLLRHQDVAEVNPKTLQPPRHINDRFTSPQAWSPLRKRLVLCLLCVATCFSSVAASSYAPAKAAVAEEWGVSQVAALVGITTFTTGFALTPMVLAPVSEVWGRRLVFTLTGVLFVACQIGSALTQSYPGMLVLRFFAGVGSSTYSSMVGGVISDIYGPQERNTPMAVFSGGALFGTGLGPLLCGFVVQHLGWRWIFWAQAIVNAVVVLAIFAFVPETRRNVLLRRKAAALNLWYDDVGAEPNVVFRTTAPDAQQVIVCEKIAYKFERDEEEHESIVRKIATSATLPFVLLFTEPVVFFFSLWAAFSWSILYLGFAAVPLIFTHVYHFDLSSANAVLASSCAASVIAMVVSIYQERWLDGLSNPKLPLHRPERRLYFSCVESICLPIGLLVFGWTARIQIHWVVPAMGIGISTLGIFSVYLAVFNYLADSYHGYASSALAAQSFCRNFIGGIFPLVTVQMYTNIGYGPASTLLSGIGLLLTACPWVLVAYGETIRAKSRFANKLAQ